MGKRLPWPRRIRWMLDAMIKELDSVVLTTDLPEHGLARGDIGTVVLVHEGGKGCTVEFMTLAGHHRHRHAAGESGSANCQGRNCPRPPGGRNGLITGASGT